MKTQTPKGVVAILVSEDGREIVNATDFNTTKPSGFSQEEAQQVRARDALASKVVRELASPLLSNAIQPYDAQRILKRMCDAGCKIIMVSVGYDG